MTSLLSFSSRLCFKLLKRLLYSCQCLLTCVCLLCTDKVCRWKFFHCLRGFLQQFTWAYLSVKWVINPLTSHMTFLFLSSSTSSLITFVCETFLDWICQHWLSYNKLSSNNINNNNVSVIQVRVSKLTAHRALILYNAYVVVLVLVAADEDSVLFVGQQQLTQYTHFILITDCGTETFLAFEDFSLVAWFFNWFIRHCLSVDKVWSSVSSAFCLNVLSCCDESEISTQMPCDEI